jgi:hypothetical protein
VRLLAYDRARANDPMAYRVAQIEAAVRALPDPPGRAAFSVRSAARDGHSLSELVGAMPRRGPAVDAVLQPASRWCEVLLLTPWVGGCSPRSLASPAVLEVLVLSRFDASSALGERHVVRVEQVANRDGYARRRLRSQTGPLGTSAHRGEIELVDLSDGRRAIALTSAFDYDWETEMAQLAFDVAVHRVGSDCQPTLPARSTSVSPGSSPLRSGRSRGSSSRFGRS